MHATLAAWLHTRHLLLVLDNFEQVLAAASLVADLLYAAPHVKMLVTSRMPLHVYGEHEYVVSPLPVPQGAQLAYAVIATNPAVRLFVARAQAVQSAFALTAENAHTVAEICRQLDGLPLAIELAAARMKLFSPHALLARLSSRLDLLTGGARERAVRQHTLRATIDWSYHLLDASEQHLFARLAVFVGGCTLEAAASVGTRDGAPAIDVLDRLHSLLDKSLLLQATGPGDEPRFVMLDTIHVYALERLAAHDDEEQVRQQHAAYYVALAETASCQLHGVDQVQWLDRLEADHDNFRAALTWLLDRGAAEEGVRLAVALARFWLMHAHLSEGRRWLERAVALSDGLQLALRAKVLFEAGGLADQQGDHDRQRVLQEASLALYRQIGDPCGIAAVLNCLGNAEPDARRARERHEESLRLYREQGNTAGVAKVLLNLGSDAAMLREYQHARVLLEESLALNKTIGNVEGIAYALINLGFQALAQDDLAHATVWLKQSLVLFQQLQDHRLIANCFIGLAAAAAAAQPVQAAHWWGTAAALYEAIGCEVPPDERATDEHYQAVARAQLGEHAFDTAWAEGRTMLLEQAIAEALGEAVDVERIHSGDSAQP